MGTAIRVALVDDSVEFCAGLERTLEGEAGIRVVAVAGNADEALTRFPAVSPDIVLVDLNLPGRDGVALLRELRPLLPEARLVVLTIEHSGKRLIEALEAGAVGYLIKTTTGERLVEALNDAMAGGSPISANVARLLVERFRDDPQRPLPALTDRERTMLDGFSRGERPKEVAARMGLSVHTVRSAVRAIYSKLQAGSMAEAVAKYRR